MAGYLLNSLDFNAIGWALLAAVLGLPRLIAGLESAGRLPAVFHRWNRTRAQRLIDRDKLDESVRLLVASQDTLLRLASQHDTLLAALSPNGGKILGNGGKSLADAIMEMELNLAAHTADSSADSALLRALRIEVADYRARLDEYVDLLRTHIEFTNPLIDQFIAMRDARDAQDPSSPAD